MTTDPILIYKSTNYWLPGAGVNQGAVVNRPEGHYRGDENVLQLVMLTQFGKFTETHRIVHLKWVNFTVGKLYLNQVVFKKEINSVQPFQKNMYIHTGNKPPHN